MNSFFELKGRLGRWDYFKRFVVRATIASFAFLSFLTVWYLLTQAMVPDTPVYGDWLDSFFERSQQNPYSFGKLLMNLLGLAIFLPLEIRRANDINLNYWWIFATHIGFFIPDQVVGIAIAFIFSSYCVVISLILQFKPGETFREWVRSKDKPA